MQKFPGTDTLKRLNVFYSCLLPVYLVMLVLFYRLRLTFLHTMLIVFKIFSVFLCTLRIGGRQAARWAGSQAGGRAGGRAARRAGGRAGGLASHARSESKDQK